MLSICGYSIPNNSGVTIYDSVNYTVITQDNRKLLLVLLCQLISFCILVPLWMTALTFHRPEFSVPKLLTLLSPVNLSCLLSFFQLQSM